MFSHFSNPSREGVTSDTIGNRSIELAFNSNVYSPAPIVLVKPTRLSCGGERPALYESAGGFFFWPMRMDVVVFKTLAL